MHNIGGGETISNDCLSTGSAKMPNAEALRCMEITDKIRSAHRMEELEEVLGDLHGIEDCDGWIIAQIGRIPVLLPEEMTPKLKGLVGKRIGILRYEGYRLRAA